MYIFNSIAEIKLNISTSSINVSMCVSVRILFYAV